MPDRPLKLVLASQSPRRRELLAAAGYEFEVVPPGESTEGQRHEGESPGEFVARQAHQKAADVARRIAGGLVVGCDTVAECDGQILGKPSDEDHARRMLETLRGRRHHVYSGLCLWPVPDGRPTVEVDVTTLCMDRLDDELLNAYLAGGQWRGKAGAFGYQDRIGWVHVVRGSPSNVVGLPMELFERMLAGYGS